MVEGMRRVEILRAACCVAGADLTIAEAEKPLLDRLAREAGVGFASLEAMMERATQNEDFYREQFRVLSADPKMTMTLLFKVAISDRQLDPQEVKILKFLAVAGLDNRFTYSYFVKLVSCSRLAVTMNSYYY